MGKKSFDFTSAVSRIFESLDVNIQSKLANALGLAQPTINYSLSRGTIPTSWLIALLRKNSLNPDWILYGEPHKKYLVPSDTKPEDKHVNEVSAADRSAV